MAEAVTQFADQLIQPFLFKVLHNISMLDLHTSTSIEGILGQHLVRGGAQPAQPPGPQNQGGATATECTLHPAANC